MSNAPEDLEEKLHTAGAAACIALKTAPAESAVSAAAELLQLFCAACGDTGSERQKCAALAALRPLLTASLRQRRPEFFINCLEQAAGELKALALLADGSSQELCAALEKFFLELAFAVCDRRCAGGRVLLTPALNVFLKKSVLTESFCREWTSLAARMARRGWQQEAGWLRRLLLKTVLKRGCLQQIRSVLMQLEMHFEMYSRRDGFEEAFASCRELQYFYLLLAGRAQRMDDDGCAAVLTAVLRSVCSLITASARAAMQDELDMFRSWHQLLEQLTGRTPKSGRRAGRLTQMAILYWQLARPRTSRKQIRYLTDLLEPDLLTEKEHRLLEKIS